MHELPSYLQWIIELVHRMGYPGIFFATFLESTFVPIPSEFTMMPAGYLIHEGKMRVLPVMVLSISGTVCGALVNYYVARYLGRPVIMRFKRYFFLNDTKIYKIETFFAKHGEVSTLTGRLVPGLRHLISFPAGLARMDVSTFCLFTAVGGGLWMGALTALGYILGGHPTAEQSYEIVVGGVVIAIILALTYIIYVRRTAQKDKEKNAQTR